MCASANRAFAWVTSEYLASTLSPCRLIPHPTAMEGSYMSLTQGKTKTLFTRLFQAVDSHGLSLVVLVLYFLALLLREICPKSQIMPEPIEGEMYERSCANYGCKKWEKERTREEREERTKKSYEPHSRARRFRSFTGFTRFRSRQSPSFVE